MPVFRVTTVTTRRDTYLFSSPTKAYAALAWMEKRPQATTEGDPDRIEVQEVLVDELPHKDPLRVFARTLQQATRKEE